MTQIYPLKDSDIFFMILLSCLPTTTCEVVILVMSSEKIMKAKSHPKCANYNCRLKERLRHKIHHVKRNLNRMDDGLHLSHAVT